MQKVLFWVRSRAGLRADEFRRYWLEAHAPLARANFTGLRSYEVNIVTGTLEGEPFVSGLAELYWESREAFLRDITSPAGKRVLEDLPNFASEGGPLLADEHRLEGVGPGPLGSLHGAGRTVEQVFTDVSHDQTVVLGDRDLRASPEIRSIQLFAGIGRFFRVLWTEMRRIPEYHDQAERLTRMLRRNHSTRP